MVKEKSSAPGSAFVAGSSSTLTREAEFNSPEKGRFDCAGSVAGLRRRDRYDSTRCANSLRQADSGSCATAAEQESAMSMAERGDSQKVQARTCEGSIAPH